MRLHIQVPNHAVNKYDLSVRLIKAPRRGTRDDTLLKAEPLAQSTVGDRMQAVLDLPAMKDDGKGLKAAILVIWNRDGVPYRVIAKALIPDLSKVADPFEIEVDETQFGDPYPAPRPDPDPKPDRPDRDTPTRRPMTLGDRFVANYEQRRALDASIQSQTKPLVHDLLRNKARARDFAKRAIGRRGRRTRATTGFVPHDADPTPVAEANRKQSLQQLRARDPRKGFRVRSELGKLSGKELASAAQSFVAELGKGPISRNPTAFEPDCTRKSRVAKARQDSDIAEDPIASEAEEDTQPFSIEAALAEVLASAGFKTNLDARPSQSDIAQNLQVDLSSGPADVPAYYDYPVLLTAWRDTWQAVLDDKVLGDVADIYDEIVKTVPPEYLSPQEQAADSAEVSELQDLLVQLSAATSAVANITSAPPDLTSWPGLKDLSAKWSYLSSYDQERIIVLKLIHDYCAQSEWRPGDKVWVNNTKNNESGDHDTPEILTAAQKAAFIEDYNYAYWEELPKGTSSAAALSHYARVAGTYAGGHGYDNLDAEHKCPSTSDPEPGNYSGYVVRIPYVLATDVYLRGLPEFENYGSDMLLDASVWHIADGNLALHAAQDILDAVEVGEGAPQVNSLGRAEDLINTLQRQSDRPYQFDVFAPDTYNFGLMVNYRQKWTPLAYQAGDLAGTLPLAPLETRSFTTKRRRTRDTSRSSERTRAGSSDSTTGMTSRAEGEISRRVEMAMKAGADANATTQGGFLGNGGALSFGGNFGSDMGNTSAQVKRELRETTRNIAQSYKDENRVEVTTATTASEDFEQTRTISNPNNELTVTYLFYELQRRFEVSERLNDLTPVILVAYKVPSPSAIDEAWLMAHDWILRDVLLDKQFLPVFDMLRQSFTGDEVAVEILEEQWKTQLRIVNELRQQLFGHTELRDEARDALDRAAYSAANIPDLDGSKKKVAQELSLHLLGEANAEEAARQALDWADIDLQKAEGTLREGISALERATDAYTTAVVARLNRRTQLDHLILHIKENILHYMQAIWTREHPDQRYLRLYDLKIDWPGQADATFQRPALTGAVGNPGGGPIPHASVPNITGSIKLGLPDAFEKRWLHEVADLGKVLGFHGNYGVFRLKDMNALSAYLLQDFLDEYFGVSDPDAKGDIPTAEEAIAMAKCAWSKPNLTSSEKDEIGEWLVNALDAAEAVSQTVVVPTGELFIEALPGAHPVLEDFKLQHRAYDMQKAGTEVTMAEVEVLRRAMRLQNGDASDPDIDKTVRIDGAAGNVIVTED